ncbi:MAG: CHAT domain-containing protein, partial [Chloroflexota bacterium]
ENLRGLVAKRNQLYRRVEGDDTWRLSGSDFLPGPHDSDNSISSLAQVQRLLTGYEEQIADLWESLLIQNADYARDIDLFAPTQRPTQLASLQSLLPKDTVLLEYFVSGSEIILFLVTTDRIFVQRLAETLPVVEQNLQFFNLNCSNFVTQIKNPLRQIIQMLIAQAQKILHELYNALVAPVVSRLCDYKHLIIVPHHSLHHIPFHALHTGSCYLLEAYHISYLPNSMLLHYCQPDTSTHKQTRSCVTFAHADAHIPHVTEEAAQVAAIMQGTSYLNQDASLDTVRNTIPKADIIHFATHGDFNAQNPLFSGLTLADGALTTFDIFHLRLRASLVTLSACETGCHNISAGDELLGLLRSFLYAGASSVVLTHWPVEDKAAKELMALFYQQLANGDTKDCALGKAQQAFISGIPSLNPDQRIFCQHPYIWASYFLVGHAQTL